MQFDMSAQFDMGAPPGLCMPAMPFMDGSTYATLSQYSSSDSSSPDMTFCHPSQLEFQQSPYSTLAPTRNEKVQAPRNPKQKRGNYVALNRRLIMVAESGNVWALLSTIEGNLSQMNLVNLSTGLHRLAKLTSCDAMKQARVRNSQVFVQMVVNVQAALTKRLEQDEPPHSQVISNVAWALATMQCLDLLLLENLAALACKQFSGFKPFEMSSVLWAFAKFEDMDAISGLFTKPFVNTAAAYMACNMEKFSFRCLVMSACAFASAGHHDASLFHQIAERMVVDVLRASSQEVTSAVWAFSTADVCNDNLFAMIATKCLTVCDMFKPEELESIARGFASTGYHHHELFAKASDMMEPISINLIGQPSLRHAMTPQTLPIFVF